MANPTLLTMPLCVNADKNTIPSTDAGTSGLFSEEYGWQNINSLPLASGGKAPNRRDFNGVFALLGGIAYACQRGQSFEWVNTLPYLAGCVVTDPLDGNKYNAKNDIAEGGTNPSLDPTNWELFGRDPNALTREVTPAFNSRDVITTSGTYTAPVTGWYKITAKGGGGGGAGGYKAAYGFQGGGGGEGGITFAYVNMTAGDVATVIIGAGGTGGAGNTNGGDGGDTSVTYNGNTYTGGGGKGGRPATSGLAQPSGAGGIGTIRGCAGGTPYRYEIIGYGANGGGAGGGASSYNSNNIAESGTNGGGGAGGASTGANSTGGAGGDGYVWFEYFASI